MGRIDIDLPEDLESRLREKVFKRFKGKHGGLRKGVIEAIKAWIERG